MSEVDPAPDQGHPGDAIPPALTEDISADAGSQPLVNELSAAFKRFRPQGSPRWNFLDAFMRLEREFGAWVRGSSLLGGSTGVAVPSPAISDQPTILGRVRGKLGGASAPAFQTTADIQADGRGRVESGFDATLEAFRYLDVRVRALEEARSRAGFPVEGLAGLVTPPDLGKSREAISHWMADHVSPGPVLHVECGDGSLVASLVDAGLDARGADPRGALAATALERGLAVAIAEALAHLASQYSSSLGGLVLSGIVDRLALGDLVELVAVGRDRLAENAPIVVVSEIDPAGGDPRSVVARDLLPGNPLHAQTWELLLSRGDFSSVSVLESPDRTVSIVTARKTT